MITLRSADRQVTTSGYVPVSDGHRLASADQTSAFIDSHSVSVDSLLLSADYSLASDG